MATARRKTSGGGRKRDYAAEYRRRQQRARSAGFGSYYDQRLRGGAKASPAAPAPRKGTEEYQRRRGHRSRADLLRTLGTGDLLTVQRTDRDPKTGRLRRVDLMVIDERGDQHVYTLRGKQLTSGELDKLIDRVEGSGAIFSPSPSLDLRRLHTEVLDDEDDELEIDDPWSEDKAA